VRVPAALAALPLIAGCLLGLTFGERGGPGLPLAAAGAGLLALLAAASACAIDSEGETLAALALGCALSGLSLGASAAVRAYHPPLLRWFEALPAPELSTPFEIEGRLREDAVLAGPSPLLIVDVQSVRVPGAGEGPLVAAGRYADAGGVRLSVAGALGPGRVAEWRAGRAVRVTSLLRLPSVYLDPGVRDERRALARRGIVLVGTVKSAAVVEVVARGTLVDETASAARAWTRARLDAAVGRWSARSGAIARAVLIGDRSGLSEADTRRLQDAGTYHVIAISGGNIAILTFIVLAVLRGMRLRSRTAAGATILLLLAYSVIVLPSPSVQRAVTVALVYLMAQAIDQRGSPLNILAIAATVGIGSSPAVLLDPGFLLSFGATLGLLAQVARARPAAPSGSVWLRLTHAAKALWWATVAAEVALLPIAAALFGRITFAGLLLNFAAIPLMSVLQVAALITLALCPASMACAGAAGWVAHIAAAGIVDSARLTEVLPAARDVVPPAWPLIGTYYAAVAVYLWTRSPRLQRAGAACAVCSVIVLLGAPWSSPVGAVDQAPLRVVFLDVGQGDATAVILPGGRAMLVDAGGIASAAPAEGPEPASGGFDIGGRVVAPALRALGVRRLETLAITHGDPDHIGGVPAILRAFAPPVVWEGVAVPPHPRLRIVQGLADAAGLRWRTVQPGDVERVGPVQIKVLHPPRPDWERQRVRNEDSIVLEIRIGDVSVVLPGDIGAEGERALLAHWQPSRLVVIKAPHHGSATSSGPALLAALAPAAVVFSAGRNNRFGHPHPTVVARYGSIGAVMFSTATDGAIILDTDGRTLSMRGWTGRSHTWTAEGGGGASGQ
jgi:competence protein ComEC